MKPFTLFSLLVVLALALSVVSCTKEPQADATRPLEQSFREAAPEIKQAVETATASLRARKYAEATRALAPVVSGRPLTEPQRQAVGVALQQINQAIAADPAIDSKEMYELRAKMFRAVHNGPRF